MPPEDPLQPPHGDAPEPLSGPWPTGGLGPPSGEPLSEIFGLDPVAPKRDPLIGVEIGGVKIIRLIAQGGMGRVYEGRQHKPGRTVAVKVMRPGLATPSMIKRFEYEAEILGRLRHPGVAQIYTAGVHHVAGAPVPYFIMEYIPDAKPITEYVVASKLTKGDRLELFLKVCDAVAHGHQQGIIHRDLKPGNILVDTAGTPKVIDFGVAKATDSDLALTTLQTDLGQRIGTLQYMGPEQTFGDAATIDACCDVYALGVVLYELLTGWLPYDVRRKAVDEAIRVICEEEPPPITAFDQALHGNLSAIAGKCLAKDPSCRYSDAVELADDLRRHVTEETITARLTVPARGTARFRGIHQVVLPAAVAIFAAALLWASGGRPSTGTTMRVDVALVVVLGIVVFVIAVLTTSPTAPGGVRKGNEKRTEDPALPANASGRETADDRYLARLFQLEQAYAGDNFSVAAAILNDFKALFVRQRLPIDVRCCVAKATNVVILEGHSREITAVAFSPDGALVATASHDDTLRLWSTSTGKQLLNVAFASNSDRVFVAITSNHRLAACKSWTLYGDGYGGWVWTTFDGRCTTRFEAGESGAGKQLLSGSLRLDRGFYDWCSTLAFSPNGGQLLVVAGMAATVFSAETGKPELELLQGHGPFVAGCFNQNGSRVAVASPRYVTVCDATTGEALSSLPIAPFDSRHGHGTDQASLVFSPDGLRLAHVDGNGRVAVWNTVTSKCLFRSAPAEGRRWTLVAFDPDASHLVLVSDDNIASLWSLAEGTRIREHRLPAVDPSGWTAIHSHCGDISIAGRRGNQVVVCRNIFSDACEYGHGNTRTFAVSADGSRLATMTETTVEVWDAVTAESLVSLQHNANGNSILAFSPDAERLALIAEDGVTFLSLASGMVHGSKRTASSRSSWNEPLEFAFSHDGLRLAVGFRLDALVWSVDTGGFLGWLPDDSDLQPALIVNGPRDDWDRVWVQLWQAAERNAAEATSSRPEQVQVAPWRKRQFLAWLLHRGSSFHLYGAETTEFQDFIQSLEDSPEMLADIDGVALSVVSAVSLSPDGLRIVLGTDSGFACVLDRRDGRVVAGMNSDGGRLTSIACSPLGRRFVTESADHSLRVWDADAGKLLSVIKPDQRTTAVIFSPDGTRLATLGERGSVRLWDANTGAHLLVVERAGVTQIAFTPDGSRLLTLSRGTVHALGVSAAEVQQARATSRRIASQWEDAVGQWIAGGPARAMTELKARRGGMSPDEYRVVSNMILFRLARHFPKPATSEGKAGESGEAGTDGSNVLELGERFPMMNPGDAMILGGIPGEDSRHTSLESLEFEMLQELPEDDSNDGGSHLDYRT